MKTLALTAAILLGACAEIATPQGQAVLGTAEQVAQVAGTAAAAAYGGPLAGQMASAGLFALGSVLNGYIGQQVPKSVVKATPGVSGVGAAVAPLISTSKPVAPSDVAVINAAAQAAAKK